MFKIIADRRINKYIKYLEEEIESIKLSITEAEEEYYESLREYDRTKDFDYILKAEEALARLKGLRNIINERRIAIIELRE